MSERLVSMVNIIKQEIDMEEALKWRLDIICDFCNTTPTIINGSIRKVDKTNEDYITPEYVKRKKKLKTHENNLKRSKSKSDKLDSVTKEVKQILDNTKLKGFNKNQCVLSLDEKKKLMSLLSK